MEDAADLYTKSAHAYKMAKKYSCELLPLVTINPSHSHYNTVVKYCGVLLMTMHSSTSFVDY